MALILEQPLPAERTPVRPDGRSVRRRRRRPVLLPYLLLLPAVAALGLLLVYPVIRVVLTSFQQLGLGELVRGETVWVGLDNYRRMLGEPTFWRVTVRTIVFAVTCVVATMVVGAGLALLLRQVSRPVRIALQVTLVLAWATPIVATTTVFQWLFDENYGIVNKSIALLVPGFAPHAWFTSGLSAFFVIVLLIVWQAAPFVTFSLYAALLAVPDSLIEAARVDGASPVKVATAVLWPMVRPLFALLCFLSLIWDFKIFTQVYVIRGGGPSGQTTTLPIYQYTQGIAQSQFGQAAAVSVVMILVLVLISAQYIRLLVRSQGSDL